jgi:hypothetical protein
MSRLLVCSNQLKMVSAEQVGRFKTQQVKVQAEWVHSRGFLLKYPGQLKNIFGSLRDGTACFCGALT